MWTGIQLRVQNVFVLLLLLLLPREAIALQGFTLNGQNWTYDPNDGGEIISGILVQPTIGTAPYPAVLISHGQGGSATSFGLVKANIMKVWGLVCIAPNYTHTNASFAIGTDGWSSQNERRARACLTILNSLGYVDMSRVAAYGHSKGAFVTAGFCGSATNGIHAAAITAGGTSGTSETIAASPATQEVQGITAPLLMLHGSIDTTVLPIQSANLQSILNSNGVTNKRLIFQGIDHPIESTASTTNAVYNLIREWFTTHGVLTSQTNTPPIISLISNQTTAGLPITGLNLSASDNETSTANLRFQIGSSLPAIIPTNNVVLSGAGTNRSLSITPAVGVTGSVTVAISTFDGQLTATTVFDVSVTSTNGNSNTNGNSGSVTNFAVGRPRGIYILDSAASTTNINAVAMRDTNIRNVPFVSGYLLRASWEDMEPQPGQYDFTIIDWNLRKVAAIGQKLSLWTLTIDPPWIAQTANVQTWFDSDPRVNHLRAVPWDSYLQQRLSLFVSALAEHQVDGIKLRDHPALSTVNFGVAGAMLAIRDPLALHLRDMTNYTRSNFTNAVLNNLRITATNFPSKYIQIGFWPVADNVASPSLWEDLRRSILTEFNGIASPRVGFWMENLSASRPAPAVEPISGKPVTSFASALYLSQTNTWTGFQALTSWSKPFNNYNDSVTNATPADGMAFAFSNYGSTYFELYVSDIDYAGYTNELQTWQNRLAATAPTVQAIVTNGTVKLSWDRLDSITTIFRSTNLTNSFQTISTVTNATSWTVPSIAGSDSSFYRLQQDP